MDWKVYLSGEIHTDWRDRIERGIADAGLPVEVVAPVTDHDGERQPRRRDPRGPRATRSGTTRRAPA